MKERQAFGHELMGMLEEEADREGYFATVLIFETDDCVNFILSMHLGNSRANNERPNNWREYLHPGNEGYASIEFYYNNDGVYAECDFKLSKGMILEIEKKSCDFLKEHGYTIPNEKFRQVDYHEPIYIRQGLYD